MNGRTVVTTVIGENEIRMIDEMVSNGTFCSRSETLRSLVRHYLPEMKRDIENGWNF